MRPRTAIPIKKNLNSNPDIFIVPLHLCPEIRMLLGKETKEFLPNPLFLHPVQN